MGTTVTGKLNKAAQQFQAGESIGFGVRIGVKYYDRQTKSSEWTNYKAVLFAKAPGQIQFLQENLIEGAIVEISGDKQKIEVYEGQQGPIYTIEILDAKIGYVSSGAGNGQNVQSPPRATVPVNNGAAQYQPNANAQPAAGYHSNTQQQAYAQPTGQQAPPQGKPMGTRQPQAPEMDAFDDDIPFS